MEFKNREIGLISFGEMILRLSPLNNELLVQGDILKKQMGGAEFNVATSVASLGKKAGILTKIPNNAMGDFVKKSVMRNGVLTDFLLYDDEHTKRIPIYYYEYGASPRKPRVTYDRAYSSFQGMKLEEVDENIFQSADIFHTSGISLGLSTYTQKLTKNIIKKFKKNGTFISFDVNFRRNLWSESLACETILSILTDVDILFASEETFRKMFKKTGNLEDIIRKFAKKYNISIIASTQRNVNSPKLHDFSSLVYDAKLDKHYTEKPYKDIDVIDRIGSGDAYCGGFLYGLLEFNDTNQAMRYGNANSVLKNTIIGDVTVATQDMIKNIIEEHISDNKFEMER